MELGGARVVAVCRRAKTLGLGGADQVMKRGGATAVLSCLNSGLTPRQDVVVLADGVRRGRWGKIAGGGFPLYRHHELVGGGFLCVIMAALAPTRCSLLLTYLAT